MLETVIFFLFASVAVAAGLAILMSTNIVRMAYWLIAMLISVAGLYFFGAGYGYYNRNRLVGQMARKHLPGA